MRIVAGPPTAVAAHAPETSAGSKQEIWGCGLGQRGRAIPLALTGGTRASLWRSGGKSGALPEARPRAAMQHGSPVVATSHLRTGGQQAVSPRHSGWRAKDLWTRGLPCEGFLSPHPAVRRYTLVYFPPTLTGGWVGSPSAAFLVFLL